VQTPATTWSQHLSKPATNVRPEATCEFSLPHLEQGPRGTFHESAAEGRVRRHAMPSSISPLNPFHETAAPTTACDGASSTINFANRYSLSRDRGRTPRAMCWPVSLIGRQHSFHEVAAVSRVRRSARRGICAPAAPFTRLRSPDRVREPSQNAV